MEENTTISYFSENTSSILGHDNTTNTNSGVSVGNLYIRLLATSHIMFKIGEY